MNNDLPILGIVAGGGDIPSLLIEESIKQKREFYVVGLKNQADEALFSVKNIDHICIRLGQIGKAIEYFKRKGVKDVVMIGNVKRPSLIDVKPDFWTAKFLAKIGIKALGDDKILRAIISSIENEGFNIIGVDDILTSLLSPVGTFTKNKPSKKNWVDINQGIKVATELGKLDVGQSVVIQEGLVLGVEAIEGTDALINRCSKIKRKGSGGVLVKLKKQNQEKRADLPTIGIKTIENAYKAGLDGIAITGNGALVVGLQEIKAKADEMGLFVMGLSQNEISKALK